MQDKAWQRRIRLSEALRIYLNLWDCLPGFAHTLNFKHVSNQWDCLILSIPQIMLLFVIFFPYTPKYS